MTLVGRAAAPQKGRRAMEHSRSRRSSRGSLREIVEEPTESPAAPHEEVEDEDRVYVAVDRDVEEGKANLSWVLQKTSRERKIILVHVYCPAQRIPTGLGWFPANKVQERQVAAYRNEERKKTDKCLDEYVNMCTREKVRKAEKLVIERNDVGKGLVELIALHGITKLVMGAAADRNFSRRMKAPKSKTALAVQQQADPSCKIWFVCKGKFICTRDASLDGSVTSQSPIGSPNSVYSQPEMKRSISLPPAQGEQLNLSSLAPMMQDMYTERSKSVNYISSTELTMADLPKGLARSPISSSKEGSVIDPLDVSSRSSDHSIFGEVPLISLHDPEEEYHFQSPQHDLKDLGVDGIMYERLQVAHREVDNSKREAYEEFCRRQKSEKDLNEAMQKVKKAESLYIKEVQLRKEVEELLEKENLELLALKQQRDEFYEELQKARQKMADLQLQISDSDKTLEDIRGKLSEAYSHLNSIRQEHEVLQQERENAVRENEELRQKKEDTSTSTHGTENFSEFALLELQQATENFHESLKIGEGGYGCVYKGALRNTTVAIKKLDPQGMQGKTEFQREMDVLSKVRHPNLVTLIGACPEAWALVYEFLPNGSLEDRLTCVGNTPPLTWKVRIRIAAEICSALIFLHSCKPLSVVHGDLKPANILLDANFVSKLGDFGICRLLVQSIDSITLFHITRQPQGTYPYMCPELISSGEITTKSDVYSFGVILLRLLTRKPPYGISRVVQEALDKRTLDEILDASAGDWSYVLAEQLAKLGLQCCDMNRKNRPDAKEVWKILEPLMKSVSLMRPEDSSCIPSYFICPIFKELMRDPRIAADGYTYEAEAIKGWLESGRDTSPVTSRRLPHHGLLPNYTLRFAIQGWLQQQN